MSEPDYDADPRVMEAGMRWAVGEPTQWAKRLTSQLMKVIRECPETTDEDGWCPCSRTISRTIQRALDEPAPEYGYWHKRTAQHELQGRGGGNGREGT